VDKGDFSVLSQGCIVVQRQRGSGAASRDPSTAISGWPCPFHSDYLHCALCREVRLLEEQHPCCVSVEEGGKSRDGDPLFLVRLTDKASAASGSPRRRLRLLISFGEHAREFLPVESFFKLVRDWSAAFAAGDPQTVFLLGQSELLLIGLANPDGRRRLEREHAWCWRGMANGVDINRNADWSWGGPGSSGSPRSEEFRGAAPFSEPETRWRAAPPPPAHAHPPRPGAARVSARERRGRRGQVRSRRCVCEQSGRVHVDAYGGAPARPRRGSRAPTAADPAA